MHLVFRKVHLSNASWLELPIGETNNATGMTGTNKARKCLADKWSF